MKKWLIYSWEGGYVLGVIAGGLAYIVYGRKIDKAYDRFAEKILPALQEALRAEIEQEKQIDNN